MKLSTAIAFFNALLFVNGKDKADVDSRGATYNVPKETFKTSNGLERVIVKYKTKEAMNKPSTMNSQVYKTISKQNVKAMLLTHEERVQLMQDVNVTVADDSTMYATELIRSRELAEEEPYGIGMVLEDVEWWKAKFASDPPAGSSKVCVVDTGYGNGHEDLPTLDQGTDGFNPQSSGQWYIDGNSHGTHCAGSIGAVGENSKGVIGVIPDDMSGKFSFFIGKGLSDGGSGSTSSVMEAVQACVDNGSNVISMSLGGGGSSDIVAEQYLGHYQTDDVLIIAAAGNSGDNSLGYPASYKSVMSVAAVGENKVKAGFSQFNEQTEISGPGVSVKSTVTGSGGSSFDYASYSGTSMACPHVAAVAGLLRMYFPDCKAFQIREAMLREAEDRGTEGCDADYGHGIVQAKKSFEWLEANPCDPNAPFKEPKGGCEEFVEACTDDSNCDDSNPNTVDKCVNGVCQNACETDENCDDGDTCTDDTCEQGVCSNVVNCAKCDSAPVVLDLTTDDYPEETTWDVKDSSGSKVSEGSPSDPNTLHTTEMCLASDEYTFVIRDAYSDGICCEYGNGGYVIKVENADDIEGGQFGAEETETFSVTALDVTPAPTPVTTTLPPTSCSQCTNNPNKWMEKKGKTCEELTSLHKKCINKSGWVKKKHCQLTCYEGGYGYEGDVCCSAEM